VCGVASTFLVPHAQRVAERIGSIITICYNIDMRLAPKLYELALEHDGVFTAGDAAAAGISHGSLVMAGRRGTIAPLSRGIYRLVHYPIDEDLAQLWEAVLWPTVSRKPPAATGVLSHLTALCLEAADLQYTPPTISITIAPEVRIRRTPPLWLDVHAAELDSSDVTTSRIHGLPITTLKRTLFDCMAAHVDRRLIERFIDDSNRVDGAHAPLAQETVARLRAALG
jgi:predicted transcriptional regulator of viral defense system